MHAIKIKNIVFGEGNIKICLPVIQSNKEDILKTIDYYETLNGWDLIEIRLDYLKDLSCSLSILKDIQEHTNHVILVTVRSCHEGGEANITDQEYEYLLSNIIQNQLCDIVDLEISHHQSSLTKLIELAHVHHIKTIISSHNFYKTPSYSELEELLKTMELLDGDILKLAVMPQCKEDVTRFMNFSSMMSTKLEKPLITMSMGRLGMISRIACKITGSVMTFASAGKSSAPGQMDLETVKKLLDIF